MAGERNPIPDMVNILLTFPGAAEFFSTLLTLTANKDEVDKGKHTLNATFIVDGNIIENYHPR